MKPKLRGNQCLKCEKTHEDCRDSSCVKAEISAYVCRVFGIAPTQQKRKRD